MLLYYLILLRVQCIGIFACIGTIGMEHWNPLCSGEFLYESFENPSVFAQIQGWCIQL